MSSVEITQDQVKALQATTGATLRECERALRDADGDEEKATAALKKAGKRRSSGAGDVLARMTETAAGGGSQTTTTKASTTKETTAATGGNDDAESPPRPRRRRPAAAPRPRGGRGARAKTETGGPMGRPIRFTLDLDPTMHRDLKMFALDNRVDAAVVVRALLALMKRDSKVAGQVTRDLRQ